MVVWRIEDPRHADLVARAAKMEKAQRAIVAELHHLNVEADATATAPTLVGACARRR